MALSSGAIAGIAVAGAVLIALVSLVCCYKCCWQKPRRNRTETINDLERPSSMTAAEAAVAPPSYAAVLEDGHVRRAPHTEDQLQNVSEGRTGLSYEKRGELHLGDRLVVEVKSETV